MGACHSQTESKEVKFLKEFYRSYIIENSKDDFDLTKVESIKKKYCTQRFLNELKSLDLEADPFLDVQDYKEKWINTLEINKIDNVGPTFQVCVFFEYNKTTHCVEVTVIKQGEDLKIDMVKVSDS